MKSKKIQKVITLMLIGALSLGAAACSDNDVNPCSNCAFDSGGAPDPKDFQASPADQSASDQNGTAADQATPISDFGLDNAGPATQKEMIEAATLLQWIEQKKPILLLDVREVWEFDGGHIANAENYPWTSGVLQGALDQLTPNLPLVVYCQSGVRSSAASKLLVTEGFAPVYDLKGGISAWKAAGFAVEN